MKNYRKNFGPILLGFLAFILLSSDARIYAQDSTGSPPQTQISPRTDAPRTPATKPTGLPTQINDPAAVQNLLAALEYQQKRADAAESRVGEWQRQADEWKGLYLSEKERADLLKGAGIDRKEAQAETNLAVGFLRQQHTEDLSEIGRLNDRISKLEASRLKWAFGGLVIGGTVCAAATVPNIFGR
jgi:hypothetical protein